MSLAAQHQAISELIPLPSDLFTLERFRFKRPDGTIEMRPLFFTLGRFCAALASSPLSSYYVEINESETNTERLERMKADRAVSARNALALVSQVFRKKLTGARPMPTRLRDDIIAIVLEGFGDDKEEAQRFKRLFGASIDHLRALRETEKSLAGRHELVDFRTPAGWSYVVFYIDTMFVLLDNGILDFLARNILISMNGPFVPVRIWFSEELQGGSVREIIKRAVQERCRLNGMPIPSLEELTKILSTAENREVLRIEFDPTSVVRSQSPSAIISKNGQCFRVDLDSVLPRFERVDGLIQEPILGSRSDSANQVSLPEELEAI